MKQLTIALFLRRGRECRQARRSGNRFKNDLENTHFLLALPRYRELWAAHAVRSTTPRVFGDRLVQNDMPHTLQKMLKDGEVSQVL